MTAGEMVYRIRRTFRDGLDTAYYRDMVRRRILDSPPVVGTNNSLCEIHAVTSADDWLNVIWMLKTFYHYSGRKYRLCIHDDGTVGSVGLNALASHFPAARIILRPDADRSVIEWLTPFPRCMEFRTHNPLSLKLFDTRFYLEADRMLLVDSDVLFFSNPADLIHRVEDPLYVLNSFNAQASSAYTVTPEELSTHLGWSVSGFINSGLGLVHKQSIRLDWCERILNIPGILSHHWRIEQTMFAACSSGWGVESLPHSYFVELGAVDLSRRPCRHYVGPIRHLMYSQGVRHLVTSGFLKA